LNGKLLNLKDQIEKAVHTKKAIEANVTKFTGRVSELETDIIHGEEGRIIIQKVAKDTQRNLEDHFSKITTLGLKAVNKKWPSFVLKFVTRRNQSEADLMFDYGEGKLTHPMSGSGGGPKDISAYVLSLICLKLGKGRASLLTDEPFRNVSPDLQEKVSLMVKMTASELGMQVVMVSHASDINISADKTFHVTKEKGVSKCV